MDGQGAPRSRWPLGTDGPSSAASSKGSRRSPTRDGHSVKVEHAQDAGTTTTGSGTRSEPSGAGPGDDLEKPLAGLRSFLREFADTAHRREALALAEDSRRRSPPASQRPIATSSTTSPARKPCPTPTSAT